MQAAIFRTKVLYKKQNVCKQENPNLTKDFICAGADGHDICDGDSGGPLMTFNSKTNRWQLSGIVSNGDCVANHKNPAAFTRVTHQLPWINKIMANN